MKRKLISFLGNSVYKPCIYEFRGAQANQSQFVQLAILELLAKNGMEIDELYVFLTEGAKKKNWENSPEQVGLKEELERRFPRLKVIPEHIGSTQSEEENWKLFDQLIGVIDSEDEVFFDITNGFRSLPILAISVNQYAKVLKKSRLGLVLYGCFENNKSVAPIIDITSMITLMDWSVGVDNYLETGESSLLADLTKQEAKRIMCSSDEQDEAGLKLRQEIVELRRLTDQMDAFDRSIRTVRGQTVLEEIGKLRLALKEAQKLEAQAVKPLEKLLSQVEGKLQQFNGDPVMDLYEVAQWCYRHRLYQQGYTFLQENLITAVCIALEKDPSEKNTRYLIPRAIHIVLRKKCIDQWEEQDLAQQEKVEELVSFLSPLRTLLKSYDALTDFRNNINHAGMKENPVSYPAFSKMLSKLVEDMRPFFEQVSADSKISKHSATVLKKE